MRFSLCVIALAAITAAVPLRRDAIEDGLVTHATSTLASAEHHISHAVEEAQQDPNSTASVISLVMGITSQIDSAISIIDKILLPMSVEGTSVVGKKEIERFVSSVTSGLEALAQLSIEPDLVQFTSLLQEKVSLLIREDAKANIDDSKLKDMRTKLQDSILSAAMRPVAPVSTLKNDL
ncbi:hypothetical protein TRVA0_010S02872 [Trichomonascus vanleenenianus]|uniref:uncharacterized protein n=1 Tax=Trichomonascus vanleenenianus TaxID=2268995 RepID=UPI003ECA6120